MGEKIYRYWPGPRSPSPRLQKQVESARAAFERGRHDHAVGAAAAVLKEQPSCLPVRRLLRAVQLKQATEKSSFGRFMANVSSAPFVFGGSRQMKEQPLAAVACADKLLLRDAHSVPERPAARAIRPADRQATSAQGLNA